MDRYFKWNSVHFYGRKLLHTRYFVQQSYKKCIAYCAAIPGKLFPDTCSIWSGTSVVKILNGKNPSLTMFLPHVCGCNGCCAWLRFSTGWSPSIFSWLFSVPHHEKNNIIVLVKQDSLRQFSIHSQNVSSTTFQSPELLIQCGFIWKETMQ